MKDVLIAHRGEPESWPENSLTGFREVLAAGARLLETDVQITADGIAVLSHDPSLLRLTGHDLVITESTCAEVQSLPAGHAERFGGRFSDYRIHTLAEFVALLAAWPGARVFVEIKHASINAFGIERVLAIVLQTLAPVLTQCILISFEHAVLQQLRRQTTLPIGWVLPHWDEDKQRLAESLAPDYLFVNRKRLPQTPAPLWEGPWRWAVYTVNRADEIEPFLTRGFDLIETNAIRRLMNGEQRYG